MNPEKINIGLIGAGFMAKAHSIAYAGMPMFFWPAPAIPVKKMIVDMNIDIARDAKEKFAFESYSADWHDIVNDPAISVVDICTPNNVHAEIAIAAAKAGKHILCEKPLALTSKEAGEMYRAAAENGVKTMVAFNYRRTPAVQLAKKYIDEGAIGDILDFRGTYLQDWSAHPDSPLSWRFQKSVCGSGALGDIGTHVVDMLRFLVGDFKRVNARAAELEAELRELAAQRAYLEQSAGLEANKELQVHVLAAALSSLENGFDTLSIQEKRTLLRLLVQKILWDGEDLHIFMDGQ